MIDDEHNSHGTDCDLDEIRALIVEEVESRGRCDRNNWIRLYPQYVNEIQSLLDDLKIFEPRKSVEPATTEDFVPPTGKSSSGTHLRPSQLRRNELGRGSLIAGRYAIEDEKSGGMGRVFFVRDVKAGHAGHEAMYAMKTVRDFSEWKTWRTNRGKSADENEYNRQVIRFRTEAKTWVSIGKHDNIIHAITVMDWGDKPYLLMEFAKNGSLADWCQKGPVAIPLAVKFILDVCRGMSHAFKSIGLVHRDIKPGNILVDGMTAKVTDLGLARSILSQTLPEGPQPSSQFDDDLSLFGTGTIPYMPQEQFHSLRAADVRSDIFAVGAVLYELVTANRLFPQNPEEQYRARSNPRPKADESFPAVPVQLSEVIRRCTEYSPDSRFQSFGELVEALEKVAEVLDDRIVVESRPQSDEEIALSEFHRPAVRLLQETFSLISLGEYEAAIDRAETAITLEPDNADHWNNKGKALAELKRYREAHGAFSNATQLDPLDARAWANLSFAHLELGCESQGLYAAKQAVAVDDGFALGWFAQGSCERASGRTAEAVKSLSRAAPLDSYDWRILLSLGVCLGESNKYSDAVFVLETAARLNPEDPFVWFHLATIRSLQERYVEAHSAIDRALELDGEYADAWALRGLILHYRGEDPIEARQAALNAFSLDPSNSNAIEVLRQIGPTQENDADSCDAEGGIKHVLFFTTDIGSAATAKQRGSIIARRRPHDLIASADSDLRLNGELVAHVGDQALWFEDAPEMSDHEWQVFLDDRMPDCFWKRWFGKTASCIYSVVVGFDAN